MIAKSQRQPEGFISDIFEEAKEGHSESIAEDKTNLENWTMAPVHVVRASQEPISDCAFDVAAAWCLTAEANVAGQGLRVSFQMVQFDLCASLPFLAFAAFTARAISLLCF
jgi:hypothetical protein